MVRPLSSHHADTFQNGHDSVQRRPVGVRAYSQLPCRSCTMALRIRRDPKLGFADDGSIPETPVSVQVS